MRNRREGQILSLDEMTQLELFDLKTERLRAAREQAKRSGNTSLKLPYTWREVGATVFAVGALVGVPYGAAEILTSNSGLTDSNATQINNVLNNRAAQNESQNLNGHRPGPGEQLVTNHQ